VAKDPRNPDRWTEKERNEDLPGYIQALVVEQGQREQREAAEAPLGRQEADALAQRVEDLAGRVEDLAGRVEDLERALD
jgi:hypothetical protein